jgi:exodeoxyribonuclease VII large subunit
METTRKIFSLTQLNTALERHFMAEFGTKNYWVTAELAQVNFKSGSMYLELVDSVNGVKTAQFTAHMWAPNVQLVKSKVGDDFIAMMRVGNKILMQVRLEYHKIYGLKLNIVDIDPSYAYGEMEREKQFTIERLKEEGVFAQQKELNLSILAKRIALIGSPKTSGFRDFCDTLLHNTAYRNFKLKYFHSSVQGEAAIKELIQAIRDAQNYDVDCIVLVRGGGSKMDLHVFNQYDLCKAICESRIPVITGIGHETDDVVADMVAYQKTITPTACAKHLYMRIYSFMKDLNEVFQDVKSSAFFQLSNAMELFQHYNNYLVLHAREMLNDAQNSLQRRSHDVKSGLMRMIANERMELELHLDRMASFSLHALKREYESELYSRIDRIEWLAQGKIDTALVEVKNLEDLLVVLNPEKLLKAGYTISTIDDEDVMNYAGELIGKELKTLSEGLLLTSKITHVKNGRNE